MTEWWDSGIFERVHDCIWFLQGNPSISDRVLEPTFSIIADYEWRFPKCGAGFVKRIWINCGCNNQIVPEFSQKCLQESKKILKPLKYPRIPSFHPLLAINAPESNSGFKILFDSCKHFWENFDNYSFDYCNHIHILFTNPTSRIKILIHSLQ